MNLVKFVKSVEIPSLVDCVHVAGDVVVGTLLWRITYWSSKMDVYWIAKTRTEWMSETGLTLNQYRRAMSVLKQKELVTVRIMKKGSLTLTHLRLGGKAPSSWVKTTHPDRLTKYLHSIDIKKEVPVMATKEPSLYGKPKLIKSSGVDGGKESTVSTEKVVVEQKSVEVASKGWLMKATDILKAHQGKVVSNIGTYWKSRMALEYEGYQKELTGKSQGQLKQLSKYLGDDSARAVIDFVITNWWKFASRAGVMAGTSFPSEPNIGFLLLHHAVAVNLLAEKTVPPPPKAGPKPVQSIAAGAEEEPVKTLTPQELAELIDGLKSP